MTEFESVKVTFKGDRIAFQYRGKGDWLGGLRGRGYRTARRLACDVVDLLRAYYETEEMDDGWEVGYAGYDSIVLVMILGDWIDLEEVTRVRHVLGRLLETVTPDLLGTFEPGPGLEEVSRPVEDLVRSQN